MAAQEKMERGAFEGLAWQGDLMHSLLQHEGWGLLYEWMRQRQALVLEKMMTCAPNDLVSLRSEAKMLKEILERPTLWIQMGTHAKTQLRELPIVTDDQS